MAVTRRSLGAAICVLATSATLLAHEDDPKILDRVAPTAAPAFRAPRPVDVLGTRGDSLPLGPGFTSQGVQLLSWLPLSSLDGAASGNDCWGYTSPSGRNYAIIGTSSSTVFVEITDPLNPQVVRVQSGPGSLWRDVKVYQDHAYSVSEGGGGIQVFSMANIDNGNVPLVGTVGAGSNSTTHNVAIDEVSGFLYRTGGDNFGLRIYSLANPSSPTFVGQWNTRYVHDAQVVTYTSGPLNGRQIAYCCSGFNGGFDQTGLDIVDVTNKSNPVVLDTVFYPNPAYSHQGWLSEDRQYFYLGDELDENGSIGTRTHVIDVSDPNNAFSVGPFTNGNTAVGHNLYTVGDLIYEANYTSGLRIFDASTNPTNPTEVAFFDTSLGGDGASFNGLWSVYPYFDNGVVIGSDLESGLFVWYIGDPQLDVTLSAGEPTLLDPNGQTVGVSIVENTPGTLVAGSEKLFYDIGAGFVEVPLTPLGGDLYDAVFPAIACGTTVNWFVSAESTSGLPWTSPAGAPGTTYSTVAAAGASTLASFDMQTAAGWVGGAPGDTATTGAWVRVNPIGTTAQPEDDRSPIGGICWVTGQGSVGGSVGENDVDDGFTTLLTPIFDLSSSTDPQISYWRWYNNSAGGSPNEDIFRVGISNNGGASWTNVEIVGPNPPDTSGGWVQNSFRVADLVTPTSQVRMRFIAADENSGSIVEAAIDDFEIREFDCDTCTTSNYCVGAPTSTTTGATMTTNGDTSIAANNFTIGVDNAPTDKFGLFYYGPSQIQTSFGDGFRCVGQGGIGTFRLQPIVQTDGLGVASKQVDFTSFPAGSGQGQITAGSTWNFQFWFRDPMGPGGTGFNLSDGLEATFCP